MPTVMFNKKELLSFVGKEIKDSELVRIIEALKPSVEEIDEENIVLELTSDRIDYFTVEGLARAIRSYIGLKNPKLSASKPRITIWKENVPVRPYIGCAIVRNTKLNDSFIKSLMNLQEIIHETYGRKRKKVAVGLHDFDKIYGTIRYVGANRDERFIPLGESKEMSLIEVLAKTEKGKMYGNLIYNSNKWPVFVDEKGIFSFPPILNSERTKITEKTKNIFIDVTGIDRQAVQKVLNLFCLVFIERGCRIESIKIKGESVEITPDFSENVFELSLSEIERILGLRLSERQIISLLKKMDYEAKEVKGKIIVVVKPYRFDIISKSDIIEDIAIAYNYDNFDPYLPNLFTKGEIHPIERVSNKIRELLIGFGFQEIVRPILTNSKTQFEKMNIAIQDTIKILNPVSEHYTELRCWLLPSVIEFLSYNTKEAYPQKVFEIGDVVIRDESAETRSRNIRKVSGAIADNGSFYAEIKKIVVELAKVLNKEIRFEEVEHPSFISGRVSRVIENDREIGILGEINPIVLENFKIYMPVAAFEFSLE